MYAGCEQYDINTYAAAAAAAGALYTRIQYVDHVLLLRTFIRVLIHRRKTHTARNFCCCATKQACQHT